MPIVDRCNRAILFFACLGLVVLGVSSGMRMLVLFSFPALLIFDQSVINDVARMRLDGLVKTLSWILTFIALAGTSALFLRPTISAPYMAAIRIVTSLCWVAWFGVVIYGLVSIHKPGKPV